MKPKNPNKFHNSYIRFTNDIYQQSTPYYFEVRIIDGLVKPILGKYSSRSTENMYLVVGVSTKASEDEGESFYWLNLGDYNSLTVGDVITCCITREDGGTYCKLWKNGNKFGSPRVIDTQKAIYPTIGLNSKKVVVEVNFGKTNTGI